MSRDLTENQKITSSYYKEAVKGLNTIVLKDKDLWYSYIVNLPIPFQVTYTVIVFHEQVFNGGLHQYFFNSYGQFAYLAIEHLDLIKAFQAAAILERALMEVNVEDYSLNQFREKAFGRKLQRIVNFDEDLAEFLDKLDEKYYSLDEDLEQLLVNFLNGVHNNVD